MNLLKAEKVFPKVVDIMGCNIKTYHAHFNFTPGREGVSEPDYETAETFMYHQDSHRVNFEMGHNEPGGPRPRLSLKCAYYLTDCSESGSGNTWIVPGSHLLDELPSPPGGMGQLGRRGSPWPTQGRRRRNSTPAESGGHRLPGHR